MPRRISPGGTSAMPSSRAFRAAAICSALRLATISGAGKSAKRYWCSICRTSASVPEGGGSSTGGEAQGFEPARAGGAGRLCLLGNSVKRRSWIM